MARLIVARHLLHDHERSCSGGYTSQQFIVVESSVSSTLGFSDEDDMGSLHRQGTTALCVLSTGNPCQR